MANLVSSIANKFYQTTTGKILSGQSYTSAISTSSGDEFIPAYTKTEGQKKYQTTSAIPNMPRPKSMFFVYFNLNAKTSEMIAKKKSLMEYLTNNTNYSQNLALYQQQLNQTSNESSILNTINNSINSTLNTFSNAFYSARDSIANALGIEQTSSESSTNRYLDYIPDKLKLDQLSFELSKYIKSIDKPTVSYTIKEYNEYNRKRLLYSDKKFNSIKINFYDVKENPVEQFFFTYMKFIDNSMFCKSSANFQKEPVLNSYDNDINQWGFNLDSNFHLIDSISIIEMFMDKLTVYTLENPKLESISFGSNEIGDYSPNEITVSFQYEGLTNNLLVGEYAAPIQPYTNQLSDSDEYYLRNIISKTINGDIATFVQKRYKDGFSYGIDTITAFIKGLFDAPKGEKLTTLKEQLLDTGRQLGFSEEISLVNKGSDAISNYKKSDNKGQYLFKLSDDPSSVIGEATGSSTTTSDTSLLSIF